MLRRLPWFERAFPTGLPAHLLPVVVERLRGTPARLADRLAGVPQGVLVRRAGDSWSIQENAGHLLDLEPDQGRLVTQSSALTDLKDPPNQCYRNGSGRAQNAGSSPSRRKIASASAAVFRRQSSEA